MQNANKGQLKDKVIVGNDGTCSFITRDPFRVQQWALQAERLKDGMLPPDRKWTNGSWRMMEYGSSIMVAGPPEDEEELRELFRWVQMNPGKPVDQFVPAAHIKKEDDDQACEDEADGRAKTFGENFAFQFAPRFGQRLGQKLGKQLSQKDEQVFREVAKEVAQGVARKLKH